MHGHDTNGAVIQNERNHAYGTSIARGLESEALRFLVEMISNEEGLPLAHYELDKMISLRASAFWLPLAIDHFDLESHFIGFVVVKSDKEAAHVEQSANLRIDTLEKNIRLQRGAQSAADFVENVQFLAAPRGLLNQVAVLHGHADLVSEREQEAQFGGSEIAVVGSAEQKHAEHAFLGLQTDSHDGAQTLLEQQLAKMLEPFFFFECFVIGIIHEVAQHRR